MSLRLSLLLGAAIAGGVAGTYYAGYLHGQRVTDAHWSQQWADRDARELRAAEQATTHWTEKLESVTADAKTSTLAARRDADAAVAAADQLQSRATQLAAKLRSCRATTAAGGSPAAPAAGDLLADVLSRIDQTAGQLAAAADAARIAGATCEQSYNALRN